jgi:hypothetical protein
MEGVWGKVGAGLGPTPLCSIDLENEFQQYVKLGAVLDIIERDALRTGLGFGKYQDSWRGPV